MAGIWSRWQVFGAGGRYLEQVAGYLIAGGRQSWADANVFAHPTRRYCDDAMGGGRRRDSNENDANAKDATYRGR